MRGAGDTDGNYGGPLKLGQNSKNIPLIADRFPASWANPFPHEANRYNLLRVDGSVAHYLDRNKKIYVYRNNSNYLKAWEILDEHVLGASK